MIGAYVGGLTRGDEPPSGWNLPPGCFEGDPRAPWNREEPKACGDCSHLLDGCCDYGICELEFEEAFDEADREAKASPWKAACWARDWIVDHYKDEQEDVCDRWDG